LCGKCIVIDFHEAEPSGLATKAVPQYIDGIYLDTRFFEERLQIRFSSLVGQISYEKLGHLYTLLTVVRDAGYLRWTIKLGMNSTRTETSKLTPSIVPQNDRFANEVGDLRPFSPEPAIAIRSRATSVTEA
jgi:hypothetical protein